MKKIFQILILAVISLTARSQIAIDTAYFRYDTASHYYSPKQKVNVNQLLTNSLNIFKCGTGYTFQKGYGYTLGGKDYSRYDQYFNGTHINGNAYFVTSYHDTILLMGGKVALSPLSTPGSIMSTASAITSLISSLNFYKYKWQDSSWQSSIKDQDGEGATYYPSTSLNIYKNYSSSYNNASDYYYAYPIVISALKSDGDSIYFDSLYYVNPTNAAIIRRAGTSLSFSAEQNNKAAIFGVDKKSERLINMSSSIFDSQAKHSNRFLPPPCNASCNSTGVTIHYYGGQNISTSQFTYLLVCNNHLKENCTGSTIYTRLDGFLGKVDYRSTNNSWPNPSDKVGITGHWCLEKTYEAYKSLFNQNSFNNAYGQANLYITQNYVVPTNTGSDWNATNTNAISIGLFKNTQSWEVTLDIIGHEFSHGIMLSSSNLGSNNNMSTLSAMLVAADEQMISEGFADIFGQQVEYYVSQNYSTISPNVNDFITGGDRPGGLLCGETRSGINPAATCNPSTMFGTNWFPTLTSASTQTDFDTYQHQNSTILSHWYYLLSQGGSGVNDNNNSYCVSGIGQSKAGQIAFLAATNYIGPQTHDYNGARLATIAAVNQLYGVGSNEAAQVVAAWYAVGVGPAFNGQIIIQNTAPNMIIATNSNYNYNAEVDLQNVTVNNCQLNVSSNTLVKVRSNVAINAGSQTRLYIAPACAGGARLANPSANSDTATDASLNTGLPPANKTIKSVDAYGFRVLPNPNNGEFKLLFDEGSELPNSISIIDLLGKPVLTLSRPNLYEYNIDLRPLSNGMFIIKVNYPDKTVSKRISKSD